MNPRNWNRRFRRGKAYPVSRSGNGGGCLPPGHLPSSGPPAPLYPGAGRMPGASDPGRALRSPSEHLSRPLHGAREVICRTEQCPLLEGLPEQFPAALYHSWRLAAFPWPEELIVTARIPGKTCRPSATGASPLRHSVPSGIHPDAGRRSAAPELPVPSGRQQGKTAHQMIQFQPLASGMNGTRPESVSLPCGSGSHARPLQR